MNETPLITVSSEILGGTPVFFGRRVPIQNLIDYLETDETVDAFLDDFPTVNRAQVERFLEEATQMFVTRTIENGH